MGSFATSSPYGAGEVTGSGTAGQVAVWATETSIGNPTRPFTATPTGFVMGDTTEVVSGLLTLTSTTQGLIVPRMSTAQKTAISSPIAGLMVYDSTLNSFSVYSQFGGAPAWASLVTSAVVPTTYTIGDILYANSTTTLALLSDVAVGSVLVSGGTGVAPAWSAAPSFGTSMTAPIVYTPSIISSSNPASATALSIVTTTTGALTLDSGTSGDINIGTNANAKIITIGNVTGVTAINHNSGSATCTWTTTNGIWSLITGTGAINIGADANAKTISIGTGASANAITLGNSTSSTVINLNAGSAGVNVGTNAIAHPITIGNVTGTTGIIINAGTGTSTWTTTNGAWQLFTGTAIINFSTDATVNTINFATGAAAKVLNILSSTGKIGFFGATAIVRITTGVAAATFVANTSGTINDTATWDGYTIGQVVKALRNYGILT